MFFEFSFLNRVKQALDITSNAIFAENQINMLIGGKSVIFTYFASKRLFIC